MNSSANLLKEPFPIRAKQTLEIISFITHEFKTPLTSIIASASLLAEELAFSPDDPKAKLLSNILASAHNLEIKTSELLELTKLEATGFHLELEPTNINIIVRSATEQISPLIRNRNQSLTLKLDPQLPEIVADSLRVEQILINLLSNASKFTQDGGSISLTVYKIDNYLVVEIQDSGPGIPPEEQGKLLQPYYRLESNKEHTPGVGLGLALGKHLVELHGGKMWMESELGKGSTFAFSLPLNSSQEPVGVRSLVNS